MRVESAIRPMRPGDEPAVISLLNHHFPRVQMTSSKLHTRLSRGARFLVAEENGEVAGFADLRVGRRALLRGLAVQAEKRGRGVGSALVQAAVSEARSLGFKRLRVEALDGDVNAVRFYEMNGFAAMKTAVNRFGETVRVMLLRLA